MTAFWVQVIVFCFSGLIFLAGICVALRRDANKTAIITLFSAGVLILIVAAINPYEIIEIAYSKKGDFKIKRHQPSPEERKEILKVVKDKPEKITPEKKKKIIKAATIRKDEKSRWRIT